MAFCSNCGQKLADGAMFCFECGVAVNESGYSGTGVTGSEDIEIGISVLLNNSNDQEFTQNKVHLENPNRTLSVKVPNWISIGQIVRLRGEGNTTHSGKKGDLLLRIDHIDYKIANGGQSARKVVYEGEIRKCPNCGDVLASLVAVCPSCGYEVRGATNSIAIKEFSTRLTLAKSEQEKISIVRNFPIPNTKEDIFEFIIIASTNIDGLDEIASAAWQTKIEQAYQKAQLLFAEDKDFSHIQGIYSQASSKLVSQKKNQKLKLVISKLKPVLPNLIVIAGWLFSILVLIPFCAINLDNVGTNGAQLILILDLIAGTIFIPVVIKSASLVPKVFTSLGLVISIGVLILLCNRDFDSSVSNPYELILIVDIICSIIIFVRMFKQKI